MFYVVNAYLATTLAGRGESEYLAILLLVYNVSPLAASLVLMPMSGRWAGRLRPVAVSGTVAVAGLVGFATLPGPLGWGAAVVAGFASTVQLILLVSLPPMIAHGRDVSTLTASMTLVGYTIAFALPVAGGALSEAIGIGTLAFGPTVAFAALVVIVRPGSGDHHDVWRE